MNDELIIEKLDQYIKELKKMGINRVAFVETNEQRAVQVDPERVQILPFQKLELLAYSEGTLIKCQQESSDAHKVYNELVKHGIEVQKRSRNIT